MRRIVSVAFALVAGIGLSAPAFAQAKPEVTITHVNLAELQAFEQIASSNERMAHRLAANPRLANNESFLNKWPALNSFFDEHPGAKDRFLADPGNYLPDVRTHRAHRVMAAHEAKSAAAPAPEANPPPATSPTAPAEKTAAPPAAPASPPAPPGAPTNP